MDYFPFRKSLANHEIFEKKKRRALGKKKTAIKKTVYHDFLLEIFARDLEFNLILFCFFFLDFSLGLAFNDDDNLSFNPDFREMGN